MDEGYCEITNNVLLENDSFVIVQDENGCVECALRGSINLAHLMLTSIYVTKRTWMKDKTKDKMK